MESLRVNTSYENKSDNFYRRDQDFKRQFCHIYSSRLSKLGHNLLKEKVLKKYGGNKYPIRKISELTEDHPEKCIIIGTFYKDQVLKPSILKEISEDNQLVPLPPRSNYNDDTDVLILEDELQRIRLEGKIDVGGMVTGIIGAVLGYVEADGLFNVEEIVFYECGPEIPLKSLDSSPSILILSGLNLAKNDETSMMSINLMMQWVFGNLEMSTVAEIDPKNIVRVIFAGNSIRAAPPKQQKNMSSLTLRTFDTSDISDSLKLLDEIVCSLADSVHIDVMPGEFDPSNHMLPQQPFHHCMFAKSAVNRSFNSVPNPYQFEIADRLILGTSGQNIDNIRKFSTVEDPLECMKNTLKWSHIAPTCPDTLPCYPYYNEDPFIIEQCPHIYFAAQNSENFQTDNFQNSNGQITRLVTIPSFEKSGTAIVVNLKTLECDPICFNTKSEIDEE